ncbi:MAG: orotidine-5'-phosphate decarboxylase [Actinomycetota bacterium]|nr:orotidine-5'-phosphate decarboxylase [Actinomycetota bacterium]
MREYAIALDVNDRSEAISLASKYQGKFTFAKIGLELFTAVGPSIIAEVKDMGYRIFLDLKLHDIPNTVRGATISCSKYGVDLLTVHCVGGIEMMRAAVQASNDQEGGPSIVGVTQLTSLPPIPSEALTERVSQIVEGGAHGFVSSGLEVGTIKARFPDLIAVVPGVRYDLDNVGDQVRVVTPSEAFSSGANLVVLGRILRDIEDPERIINFLERDRAEF